MAYGTLNAGAITPGSGNTLAISEAVTVPTPTATTHAATKSYVDTAATQATTAAQGVGTGDSPTFAGFGGTAGQITAKAWVNFNGEGTVAIRDSHNVSSITDNGVGFYTTNFANSLANTNYTVAGSAGHNYGDFRNVIRDEGSVGQTVSSFRCNILSAADTFHDVTYVSLQVFGD